MIHKTRFHTAAGAAENTVFRTFGESTSERIVMAAASTRPGPSGCDVVSTEHSCFVKPWFLGYVIPAQAGIQCRDLDSRLRGNDGEPQFQDGEP
jgi:hypothetical protein